MNVANFRASRRSIEIGAALVALVSLAIGAHAAFNKRHDAAKAVTARHDTDVGGNRTRLALVIGNSRYPDAETPLTQQVSDARALTVALRNNGFDVDAIEDAGRDEMLRAVARLRDKITSDSIVMLYFGGYGVQAGRENFMIPIDAAIWTDSDIGREGVSIEAVLQMMHERSAHTKLAVIDASRRNPYERRFRTYSHGLAPIGTPDNAVILSSASPGKVINDVDTRHSALMTELLVNLGDKSNGVAAIFGKTRSAVSQMSQGTQVPSVTSSLVEDIRFGNSREASAVKAGS